MADDPKLSPGTMPTNFFLRNKTFAAISLFVGAQSVYDALSSLYLIATTEERLSLSAKVFGYTGLSITVVLGMAGFLLIAKGAVGIIELPRSPGGKIFDFVMPPDDAEYRALAMEIAFENWRSRYSLPVTWVLYCIQTVLAVGLYYVDRIKRGK